MGEPVTRAAPGGPATSELDALLGLRSLEAARVVGKCGGSGRRVLLIRLDGEVHAITVTYVGDQPDGEAFVCALRGPGIAMPALIARWTPEGRPEPWTSIAGAGLFDPEVACP